MKTIKKYLVILCLSLFMVTACNEDVIYIQPEADVLPDVALKRVSGINTLIVSAYRRMHEFTYYGQQQILNAEALADNLVIANNTGRYTGQVVNGVNQHFGIWSAAPYQIINDANIVLANVDAAEPALRTSGTLAGFPEDETFAAAKRTRYKGEAHFLRALAYHDLVKVYGYEPGMEVASFNLGVILRTTPTTSVSDADKRARSTNEEVYTQIESDLLNAIALLPAEADFIASTTVPAQQWAANERTFRASKASAKALLARVYLFWGRYAQAATLATEAMAETQAVLATAAGYATSFANVTRNPESLFELNVLSADWSTVDGVNNSLASITTSNAASNSQFAVGASAELVAAYEAGDVRRNLIVNNAGRNEMRKWTGEKGNFLENIPLIRRSEMLLIVAEGNARSGNDPAAQTAINTLRTNRGLAATTATGATLTNLIMNERRVELAFEGHRFFDLKRLGMNIVKPVALGISDVPYSDYRILANIPNAEITYNELLQQNPNY
jgi:starch-binding outer membrane protein, SusD/RagB family